MPRKKNSRAAQGAGNIRKKTVLRNGKEYTFGKHVSLLAEIPARASRFGAASREKLRKRYARKCRPPRLPSTMETILSRRK